VALTFLLPVGGGTPGGSGPPTPPTPGGGGGGGSSGGSLTFNLPDPSNFPVVVPATGLVPQSPTALQTQLLSNVSAVTPGYTPNLPGTVIEDFSSTDIASLALADQAKVELTNSFTPFGSNDVILPLLGQQAGLTLGSVTNTTVPLVFTSSTHGYVITQGFLVTDGTTTYAVRDGGVIGSTGTSTPILAVAITTDSNGVSPNTVTTLVTQPPASISLSVNNPSAGTPGSFTVETLFAYRARVLQASLAKTVSTGQYIKAQLLQIPGITSNAISVQQVSTGGYRVIYAVLPNTAAVDQRSIAYALFMSVADVGVLQGSAINADRNVSTSLVDYPNTYSVTYVEALTQQVIINITWNTSITGFAGGGAFASLVQSPLAAYINALAPGEIINVLEMNNIFQSATAGILDPSALTRLVFSVEINGTPTPQAAGTYAIFGDPESNFNCPTGNITVLQG